MLKEELPAPQLEGLRSTPCPHPSALTPPSLHLPGFPLTPSPAPPWLLGLEGPHSGL